MRKLFFILIGIISAGFALYFFACSTVDMFKMMVPRSASKVRSAKQVIIYPLPTLWAVEAAPFQ
jgi:hypothetical protein